MSTSIKRLKQNGKEFVPITLAEAVVVNGEYIWNQKVCTTLDNVLRSLYSKDTNIEAKLEELNNSIQQSPSNLIPGKGISITVNNEGETVISSDFSLYKLVETLPEASEECLDKIYLVGTAEGNLVEYICVNGESGYYFEQIGFVQVSGDVDLSNYVTTAQFQQQVIGLNQKINNLDASVKNINNTLSSLNLSAVDILDSNNQVVSVDYDIPSTLYDNIIDTDHIQ